ncbi:MAG TPA: hypothetical protein VFU23_00075 [Gemmatimonadales bacterium]|nr:hypothetical protein [Gemmatimonadales bacterium]
MLEARKPRAELLQAKRMYKKAAQKKVPGAVEALARVRRKLGSGEPKR